MAKISIDFVSDVACPWCAVGLGGLLAAIERLRGEAEVELHFRPFELNPDMPKGGQNTIERLMAKYGYDRERIQANRKVISERAAPSACRCAWPTTTAPTTPSTRIGCCIGPGCRIPPCRSR